MKDTYDIFVFSYKLFKKIVTKYKQYYIPLEDVLKKAHISVPAEHWFAFSIFATLLFFMFVSVFSALLALSIKVSYIPTSIIFSVLMTAGVFALFYFYPFIVCDERKKKIDNALSFTTLYIASIARSGFPPQKMFEFLASFRDYGELSVEANKMTNDIKVLGLDLPTVLTREMVRSPSPSWTELLAGLRTTITVGGDLGSYLGEKAKGFISDYKRRLADFSNLLTLLVEIYITLVIVGSIFFIVTTSIVVAIGGISLEIMKAMNYIMVLIGIPVLTFAFILIAKGASPLES